MSNYITIEIHGTKNFSKEEEKKFSKAVYGIHTIINSAEFKDRFLSLPLEQTNNMSPIEIYQLFMSGKDKFNKVEDKDIDIYITMYYSWKNTIGYTYPSTWFTWINRKYFSRFSRAEIAGNIIHEYMHNLGFNHRKPTDYMSVPYATGYLVRDMIKEIDDEGLITPIHQKKKAVYKRSWKYLWLKKVCYWQKE